MKNALQYLGFLSPLSLLYFVTGDIGFAGFALYFTRYSENDERLQRNVGLATRNAFLYIVFVGAISAIYITIIKDKSFFSSAFTLLFSGSIIICVLSYFFYNFKEEGL